jgi:Uma2 family endonuclease
MSGTAQTQKCIDPKKGMRGWRSPRIGPGSAGMLMTPGEFDARPEEDWVRGYRYELINGVLVVSPIPGAGERSPNEELGYLLRIYMNTHPEGRTVDETLPEQTVTTLDNRRRADRVIWVGLGRTPDPEKDLPAIVVEFVGKRRRDALSDYEQKRDEYLKAGVREYWIIDRFRRIMTVYRIGDVGPTYIVITEQDTYTTSLLPGFSLALARLLAKADIWRKSRTHRQSGSMEAPQ